MVSNFLSEIVEIAEVICLVGVFLCVIVIIFTFIADWLDRPHYPGSWVRYKDDGLKEEE